MIIGIFIIAMFALLWIGSLIGIFYASPFFQFFAPVQQTFLSTLGLINLLFVIGLILLSAVLFIARLVFGTRIGRPVKAGMMVLWVLNVVSLAFVATSIARDFDTHTEFVRSEENLLLTSDTIHLEIGQDAFRNAIFNIDGEVKFQGDKLAYRGMNINVEPSKDEQFRLIEKREARGKNSSMAQENADLIDYKYQLNASTLTFDPNVVLEVGQPWRNQELEFTLQVPKGKFIIFAEKTSRFLRHVEKSENEHYIWKNPGKTWLMEADGLICLDCSSQEKRNQESISLDAFQNLNVDGDLELEILKGDKYELLYRERDTPLDVVVLDGTLTIAPNEKSSSIEVTIITPQLEKVVSSKLKDLTIKGFDQPTMHLAVDGRTRVKLYTNLEQLVLDQSGANEVVLRGAYGTVTARLADKARLEAEKAEIKIADITLSGDSKANMGTVESINKKIDDSSELQIK